MQKTWADMTNAQVDITMLTIMDPSCTTLRESLKPQPVMTSDPDDDPPTREQVIKTLPQTQNKAVTEHCIALFDNLNTATHHISMAMANLSSLAKQVDIETFRIILRASACPLVQININEGMLDPTKDKLTKLSK